MLSQLLQQQDWCSANKKIVVAVSGGIDSMVLLDVLLRLPKTTRAQVIVGHVNHYMREKATADAQFVADYCMQKQIPCYQNQDAPQLYSEKDAREFRYAFLLELARQHQCQSIVFAHHLDDQIETTLMRLIRSSTLQGIAGMPEKRQVDNIQIVRPFLTIDKQAILSYAKEHDVPFVEDETNSSALYTRNRIRHQMIPLLQSENAQFKQHIQDFQMDLQDVLSVAKQTITPIYQQVIENNTRINGQLFRQQTMAMQRLLIQEWLQQLQLQGISSHRKQGLSIVSLLQKTDGQRICHLTEQWQVRVSYGDAFLELRQTNEVQCHQQLVLNQIYDLGNGDSVMLVLADYPEAVEDVVYEIAEALLPLRIRTREAGDKIAVGHYHKKISRLFIDEKVAYQQRDSIPLLVSCQNDVLAILNNRFGRLYKRAETDKIEKYKVIYRKRDRLTYVE